MNLKQILTDLFQPVWHSLVLYVYAAYKTSNVMPPYIPGYHVVVTAQSNNTDQTKIHCPYGSIWWLGYYNGDWYDLNMLNVFAAFRDEEYHELDDMKPWSESDYPLFHNFRYQYIKNEQL